MQNQEEQAFQFVTLAYKKLMTKVVNELVDSVGVEEIMPSDSRPLRLQESLQKPTRCQAYYVQAVEYMAHVPL